MDRKKDRIIIDTNLWISFILTGAYAKLDKIFSDSSITLLFSEELLEEFIEVASRAKFKKYFSMDDLKALLKQIEKKSEFIVVTSKVEIC